jgi:hypothetical protein
VDALCSSVISFSGAVALLKTQAQISIVCFVEM